MKKLMTIAILALAALAGCGKENGGEPKAPEITITVQPAPTTTVTAGEITGELTVGATVTGDADLSYQWYSNTKNSSTGGKVVKGETTDTYTIPADLPVGTKYYFCEVSAEGAASVRSDVARVTVEEPGSAEPAKPGAVTSLEVTSNAPLEVTLNWTAPANEGSKAITKYQVWMIDPSMTSYGWADVLSGTTYTIPYEVSGGGDTWTVKVRAVNEVGEGAEKTITFAAWLANPPEMDYDVAEFPVMAWKYDNTDYSGCTIKGTYALNGGQNIPFEKVITKGTTIDSNHYIKEGNYLKYDISDYYDGYGWCRIEIRTNGTTLTADGDMWMPSDYVFFFEY